MNRKTIENILAAHADAMNRNQKAADELVNSQSDIPAELASLLQIASSMRSALNQKQGSVRPRPIFRAELKRELDSFERSGIKIGQSITRQRSKWLAIAGAGSALSAIGIILLLWRRLAGKQPAIDEPLKVTAAASASASSL